METYSIRARFEADCPPADVKRWLDNPEGISGWWSDSVEGRAGAAGDVFRVRFPTTPVVFEVEVTRAEPGVVEWRVPENPPWWKGTTIGFELSDLNGGSTQILFTHGGFDPSDEIIPVITLAWVRFLDNLVAVAESGQPNAAVVN